MQTVKTLRRVNPIRFTVKPMVRKVSVAQERGVIISSLCASGLSYQQAIREFDKRGKQKASFKA
jgi:hypothetical protein